MLTLLTIPYVASRNFLLESVSFFKMKEREAGLALSKVVKQQMKVKQIVENHHSCWELPFSNPGESCLGGGRAWTQILAGRSKLSELGHKVRKGGDGKDDVDDEKDDDVP